MGAYIMKKRIGAKMDQWGTPYDRGAASDSCSPMLTLQLLDRYSCFKPFKSTSF